MGPRDGLDVLGGEKICGWHWETEVTGAACKCKALYTARFEALREEFKSSGMLERVDCRLLLYQSVRCNVRQDVNLHVICCSDITCAIKVRLYVSHH